MAACHYENLYGLNLLSLNKPLRQPLHGQNAAAFGSLERLEQKYFQRVLIHSGVIDALRNAGIEEGDTVSLYDLEFDFVE